VGIGLSKKKLNLLHHSTILGGSWLNDDVKLVALTGLDKRAVPVKIIPYSVRDIKTGSLKMDDIASALGLWKRDSGEKALTRVFHMKI
jgi:hypothetical protein